MIQVSSPAQQAPTDFRWTLKESGALSPGVLSTDTGMSVLYTAPKSGAGTVRVTVTRPTDKAVGFVDFTIREGRRP